MTDIRILLDLKDEIKNIHYSGNVTNTRGLYDYQKECIWINLSCNQFRTFLSIDEAMFIEEFAKTVVHEEIHKEIARVTPLLDSMGVDGEDKICKILANQGADLLNQ